MTTQNSAEITFMAKRKKILAAVTQDIVNSDDDSIDDSMGIYSVMENQINEHSQIETSSIFRALGETIRNTLLEINVIREQNRERRHRELLHVLTQMVQQENTSKHEVTNSSSQKPSLSNVGGADCTKKEEISSSNEKETNDCSAITTCENINNQNHVDNVTTAKDSSKKYIKLVHENHVNNQPQACKVRNSVASKNGDKELQLMRTQMLEIQRKKMEDRERKKRKCSQLENK